MTTTGFDAASATTPARIRAVASVSAASNGSLSLECTDDAAQRSTGDPHERNRDGEKRHGIGFEAQALLTPHVHAERNGDPAATACAAVVLAGAASEAGPGQRDRCDVHAVDALGLTIGALHAEGGDLLTQFECDVRHPPTLVQADAPRDAHSRPNGRGASVVPRPPWRPRCRARVIVPAPNRSLASSSAPSRRRCS